MPMALHQLPRLLQELKVEVVVAEVSPAMKLVS
jgi:hypothetical protein